MTHTPSQCDCCACAAQTHVLRTLAPDDLAPGQYVCVMSVAHEYLHEPCFAEAWSGPSLVTLTHQTFAPPILRVIAVCTPLVLTRRADRTHETVDLRRERLALLPEAFAREVWKAIRADENRAKKSAARPKRS